MKFICEYEGPWASPKKLLAQETGSWRYQRPFTDAAKCCGCGTCYIFCSSGCVICTGARFTANLEYCKGCGVCMATCPKLGIFVRNFTLEQYQAMIEAALEPDY